MTLTEFTKKLSLINRATSVSGKTVYIDIVVKIDLIHYTRESTGSEESILIQDLYSTYISMDKINTQILRNYIKGYRYSPALAILLSAKFYEKEKRKGQFYLRISKETISETIYD